MNNYTILLIYLIGSIIFILVKPRNKIKDFIITRKTNWVLISFSITAALVGGNTFVTFTGFVNKYGISAMWYFIGLVVGLLLLTLFINNFRGLNELKNISISDYFENIYGWNVAFALSIVNLIRFLSICIIQLIAGGKLLSELLNIPYGYSVFIIVLTITLYVFLRGFQGVLRSDLFQVLFILIPLIFATPSFSTHVVNIDKCFISIGNAGIGNILVFLIFGIALIIGSADIWQRIICLEEIKSFRKVTYLSISLLTVIGGLITLMGLSSVSAGIKDSNKAFLFVITSTSLAPYVKQLCVLAILSAILSTADTFLMGSATIISSDILKKSGNALIAHTKIYIILIAAFCTVFALVYSNILNIALFLVKIIFTISPFIFAHLIGIKIRPISILSSIIAGAGYIIILLFLKNISVNLCYGSLLIATITLIFVNYFPFHKASSDIEKILEHNPK